MDIPIKLKNMQQQFSQIITMPFDPHSDKSFQIQNQFYHQGFLQKIESQNGISSCERMQNYNRSYWFRLITILQKDMPLMRHIIGLNEFNKLAMTYLTNYPPRSQFLNNIADDILTFMNNKHQWNNKLLREITTIELAHIKSFDALQKPFINSQNLEGQNQIMHQKVALQHHCFLIQEHYNLMELYKIAENDHDDKITLKKPIKQTKYWLIFRFSNKVQSQEIHAIQYQILKYVEQKKSLNNAINKTITNLKEKDTQMFIKHVTQWFAQWVEKGIFYINE